tara:strand:- start:32 stop:196 length:165 start_codon:yes stop_codon:yes gene_type:complete
MTYILKTMNIRGTVDYVPYRSLYKAILMMKSLKSIMDVQIFLLDKQAGLTPIIP